MLLASATASASSRLRRFSSKSRASNGSLYPHLNTLQVINRTGLCQPCAATSAAGGWPALPLTVPMDWRSLGLKVNRSFVSARCRWHAPQAAVQPDLVAVPSPMCNEERGRQVAPAPHGLHLHGKPQPAAGGTRILREPWDRCARDEPNGLTTGRNGRTNRCADPLERGPLPQNP